MEIADSSFLFAVRSNGKAYPFVAVAGLEAYENTILGITRGGGNSNVHRPSTRIPLAMRVLWSGKGSASKRVEDLRAL
jgi:hypothetical protein